MNDQRIEDVFQRCGGYWDGDRWVIEDADLHPFACSLLAEAHAAPPSPLTEQDKEDAERYTIDEITEAVLYAEIPDGQFESMLISLNAIRAARAKKEPQ